MFSSLEFLKIDSSDYIKKYTENFNNLIKQKDKDRSLKIDQIMTKLRNENIFKMIGDDDFKNEMYINIKMLLQVKPGRLLVKELIELVTLFPRDPSDEDYSIPIKSGNIDFRHSDGTIEIDSNSLSKHDYNALSSSKMVTCLKPKAITLAHELFHELHHRKEKIQEMAKDYFLKPRFQWMQNDPFYDPLRGIKVLPDPQFKSYSLEGFEPGLRFKKLDTLEEQHTILGVNIVNFIKNGREVHKSDILCENAFLCAFNLLPRIDHQQAENNNIENIQLNHDHLSSYYDWLMQNLDERNAQIEPQFSSYL